MALSLFVNGQPRVFELSVPNVYILIRTLGFQEDRIAVEHNGTIVPRRLWPETILQPEDRLEVVHFVGGGVPVIS